MMRKALFYILSAVTVAASGWFVVKLYQMLFCYTYEHTTAYPLVSLFLMVGRGFVVYAALAVTCLIAATVKGGMEE